MHFHWELRQKQKHTKKPVAVTFCSLTLTHASHNGPVCGGSVFTSPWQWLSASQGFLEGVEGLAPGKGAVKEEFANLAN